MELSAYLKNLLDTGVAASKELAGKAGAKAQELGEIGVLKFELSQLQSKLRNCVTKLGTEAYKALVENSEPALHANDVGVRPILDEIDGLKVQIEKKENDLALVKTK
jgi:hypothetical protein